MKKFNEYEKGFLEAFIDTDGGIYATKRADGGTVYLHVTLFNNCKELLDKVQMIIGSNKNYIKKEYKDRYNYELRYHGKQAAKILKQLNLILKEPRRKLLIQMSDLMGTNHNTKENMEKIFELYNIFRSS
jgi:hypothetical protein